MGKNDAANAVERHIDEINGSCRAQIIAGINGNIPSEWSATNLRAQFLFRSPPIGVWVDAYENVGTAYVGAKVEIDAPCDHLKLADELARRLSEKIAARGAALDDTRVRVRLDEGARLPSRHLEGASGYDLCALRAAQVQPGRIAVIKTGVHIDLPVGIEAQVRPRSGLAEHGLWVNLRTVDRGYTGDVSVLCVNHGTEAFQIAAGDRVAQLVFSKVEQPDLVLVDDLSPSVRGDGMGR